MAHLIDLLAIRPHPDDESSGTGGLLAKYGALGRRTAVITCTGGEEGEIHDPDLVYDEAFPRLDEIRERELRAACEVLRVADLRLLGYRDSGMAGTEANQHPAAFMNVDLEIAASRAAALIRELRPALIVTDNEEGGYGHPDHIMCHRVAVRGWELAADPAAPLDGEPWLTPRLYVLVRVDDDAEELIELMRREGLDTSRLERRLERRRERNEERPPPVYSAAIDVSDYAELQQAALRCHRTQIPADSMYITLPPHLARRAFATAYLRRLHPEPVDGELESELFG